MHRGILGTIGSPLVQVESPPGTVIAAKVESKNPGGSAKDRPAVAMVEAAERDGLLSPGDRIVEPTSGNTGIGISLVAAAKGYDATIVMPSDKSPERRAIMKAYGADLELVDGDISDAKDRADEIEREEGAVQLGQFENPANPEAHYRTTAEEILDQIGSREPDALVAGVGTGGTLTGNARRLREEFPDMEVIAVEPEGNTPIRTGEGGSDDFQGMGPGFVSENTDTDLIDDVEVVSLADAEVECRRLARQEGILVGQSSGASNLAAKRVAERLVDDGTDGDCPQPDNATDVLGESDGVLVAADDEEGTDCPFVLTVFWDSGERYVSTGMFD